MEDRTTTIGRGTTTTDPERGSRQYRIAMADHYGRADNEFGFSSLCRMEVPGADELAGLTVLDIGCRRGKGVFKLSDRVGPAGRAIGVDWVGAYIDEANERKGRAWMDSGLSADNMAFFRCYPEDLSRTGLADGSVDYVFLNDISNLFFDQEAAFLEIARLLARNGRVTHQTVIASGARDPRVVEEARAMGNSVQSAMPMGDYEALVERSGLRVVEAVEDSEVYPYMGALPGHAVRCADSDEDVAFRVFIMTLAKQTRAAAPRGE